MPGKPSGKTSSHRSRHKHFGKRSRKWLIGITTGVVIAVVAGIILEVTQPWFTSQPAESIGATQVIYYEPWNTNNPSGNTLSNVHVAHNFTGYCWERSLLTNRSDAYRCVSPAHNILLDPCFASPFLTPSNATQVVCPYPVPDSIAVLRLTRRLSSISATPYKGFPPSRVWFLVLVDGADCIAAGATINIIGGELQQNYYVCPGSHFSLYGYPQHASSTWTILEQKNGSPSITYVPIAKAYY